MLRTRGGVLLACLALLASSAARAQMPFSSAVDLALRNSSSVAVAEADRAHAAAALNEVRDAYVPSLTFSSGLAYTNGFPIGDPSVVKFTAQSLLFNFAQKDNIRAARAALGSALLNVEDQRQQVILDTALTYTELVAIEGTAAALGAQGNEGAALVRLTQQRIDAGLDAALAGKRAQLREAQTKLKRLNMQARAAELRQHLADLTGMPSSAIKVDSASVPAFPPVTAVEDPLNHALEKSPAVKEADQQFNVRWFEARAQHRFLYRPEFDFVAQYGYFANYNNYAQYYENFTNSNAAIGMQISVPLFNRAQVAHARQADADALKAKVQASAVRDQIRESTVTLLQSVEQTSAAEDVSRLTHEISAADAETLATQAQNGTGTDAPPVTPQQVSEARIAAAQNDVDYQVARFEHTKAELNLLKATGDLETWAKSGVSH